MPYWVNSKGEVVKYFTYGERITLRFEIEFLSVFNQFNVGIGVNRMDGQRVFTSHLLDDHSFMRPTIYKGNMVLDTEFDITSLAPGLYMVSFGVRDEKEETILYSEDELNLEIGSVHLKNAGYGVLWHTTKWMIKN
jgi:hypothetical protein